MARLAPALSHDTPHSNAPVSVAYQDWLAGLTDAPSVHGLIDVSIRFPSFTEVVTYVTAET